MEERSQKGSTWEIVCGVSTEKSRSLVKTLEMVESNGDKPEHNRHGGHEWGRFLGRGDVGMVRARGLGKSESRSSSEGWRRSRDRRREHQSGACSGEAQVRLKHIHYA